MAFPSTCGERWVTVMLAGGVCTVYPPVNSTSCLTWDRIMVLDPYTLEFYREFNVTMRFYPPGVDALPFLLCFPSVCFVTCVQGRVCAPTCQLQLLSLWLPVRSRLVVVEGKILTGWHSLCWQLILIKGVLGGMGRAWGMFFFFLPVSFTGGSIH